jgi:hypothetical protein
MKAMKHNIAEEARYIFQITPAAKWGLERHRWANSEICKAPATTAASINKPKARRTGIFRFCANDRTFSPSRIQRKILITLFYPQRPSPVSYQQFRS